MERMALGRLPHAAGAQFARCRGVGPRAPMRPACALRTSDSEGATRLLDSFWEVGCLELGRWS
jgi:hypothetical protein